MCALVTGVQTCALPIYFLAPWSRSSLHPTFPNETLQQEKPQLSSTTSQVIKEISEVTTRRTLAVLYFRFWRRSEERRVGKSVSVRVDLGGRRIIKKKKKL